MCWVWAWVRLLRLCPGLTFSLSSAWPILALDLMILNWLIILHSPALVDLSTILAPCSTTLACQFVLTTRLSFSARQLFPYPALQGLRNEDWATNKVTPY